MNALRLLPQRASLIALAALALAACNRESPGPPVSTAAQQAPASTAASAASAAASSASAPGSAPAQAAAPLVPDQVTAVAAASNEDVTAGQQIATQGAQGAAACASCHGANGEGNGQAGFPRLAALGRPYLEHQLASYADGTRQNAVMQPIATALGAQQRSVVAAYYASLGGTAPAATARTVPPPVLAERGDDRRGIQACANCHGPQGIGDAAANPYLAGQHAQYLANALAAWKGGTRNNDPSGQMPAIAKAMTDADTSALVAYFASLPPPAPRNQQAATVAVNTSRPAVQSGPVAPTLPTQGVGTEQGAPLTGSTQGPGSGGAGTNPAQTPNR